MVRESVVLTTEGGKENIIDVWTRDKNTHIEGHRVDKHLMELRKSRSKAPWSSYVVLEQVGDSKREYLEAPYISSSEPVIISTKSPFLREFPDSMPGWVALYSNKGSPSHDLHERTIRCFVLRV